MIFDIKFPINFSTKADFNPKSLDYKSNLSIHKMGNYLPTDENWYVYRRVLSTDVWVDKAVQFWPNTSLEDALSQFKHEAFAFALARHTDYEDTKSIYLYKGKTRIAKAHLDPDTNQFEIWSVNIREWLTCPEMLSETRYPELQQAFFGKFIKNHAWVNSQAITFIRKDSK